jgi:hypothetical protein
MRKPFRKTVLTFILVFYFLTLFAQESTVSSGNSISSSSGSISYSIGQVAYITNTGSNGSTSQGVQQPYEIYVLSSSDKITDLNIKVYPNPVYDILTLQYSNYTNEKIGFQILNIEGKLIRFENMTSSEVHIDFQSLASGEYYVKVTDGFKELKVFKIVKP